MQLLTVSEAATQLAVSKSTLYSLIEAGRIAVYRVGARQGGIRISQSDLDDYLASCRQEPHKRTAPSASPPLRHLKL